MALKDLELLTGELETLAELMRVETRPQARTLILLRVQEIVGLIKRGER
jgi:hypothetical protein